MYPGGATPGPYFRGCSVTKSMLQQPREGRQGTSSPEPLKQERSLKPTAPSPASLHVGHTPANLQAVRGCCVKVGSHPSSQAVPDKVLAASRPGRNWEAEATLTHGTDTNAVSSHRAQWLLQQLRKSCHSRGQAVWQCGPDTLSPMYSSGREGTISIACQA